MRDSLEIFVIVLNAIMLVCSSIILVISLKFSNRKSFNKTNVDIKILNQLKEKLESSNSPKECSNLVWNIVSNNCISTPISINKRKLSYSDEWESLLFCDSLSSERIAVVDKMDKEIDF